MSRRCSDARVRRRDAQQLVVAAGLVRHPEHADRTALDEAAREGRLVKDDQRVQRVAVLAEGVLDEAVVGRVGGRGEESTVQTDPTGLVVHLVLVPRTLRDLDRDVELHRWLLHDQHIVLVVKCPSRRCVIAKGAVGRARAEALAGRETACDAGRERRTTASGTGRGRRTSRTHPGRGSRETAGRTDRASRETAGRADHEAEDLAVHRGRRHRRTGTGRRRGDRRRSLGLLRSAYGRAGPGGRPGAARVAQITACSADTAAGAPRPAPSAASGAHRPRRRLEHREVRPERKGPRRASSSPLLKDTALGARRTAAGRRRRHRQAALRRGRRPGPHPRLHHEDRHRRRRAVRPRRRPPPHHPRGPRTRHQRTRPRRRRRPHPHRPQGRRRLGRACAPSPTTPPPP